MKHIEPIAWENRHIIDGLSPTGLDAHYKLYLGYVEKCNEIWDKLDHLRRDRGISGTEELQSLKVDLTYALGAVKNHELFFDVLGGNTDGHPLQPEGEFAEIIKHEFGSLALFLIDLKRTALSCGGWAWTTLDLDHGHLFNYGGTRQHTLPVWNSTPILALDLYVHAYAYDFPHNKSAYIDCLMSNLNWQKIADRYDRAKSTVTCIA